MTLSTYAHPFDEHDGVDRRSAADHILTARAAQGDEEVSVLCMCSERPAASSTQTPAISSYFNEPSVGLEPTTPSLPFGSEAGRLWVSFGFAKSLCRFGRMSAG
jgi:hypothetical protein